MSVLKRNLCNNNNINDDDIKIIEISTINKETAVETDNMTNENKRRSLFCVRFFVCNSGCRCFRIRTAIPLLDLHIVSYLQLSSEEGKPRSSRVVLNDSGTKSLISGEMTIHTQSKRDVSAGINKVQSILLVHLDVHGHILTGIIK